MHEHKKRMNDMHDDKNKIDHDMKEQHHHFLNAIKYYIRWSLQQDDQDLRQRIDEKYYMEMALPAGVQVPASKAPLPQPTLTLQQLREKVQREEERQRQRTGGYYVSLPGPNHQQDKDRLLKLEEEEERVRLREEELQRQAGQQGVPEEHVHQVQEVHVDVPEVPEEQVDSSTLGSSRTSGQSSQSGRALANEESEEYYLENILEYMKQNWLDEEAITAAQDLHEGVLYYISIEEITELLKQSTRGDSGEREASKPEEAIGRR
eukprot:1665308-Amphidinium_carterae.1